MCHKNPVVGGAKVFLLNNEMSQTILFGFNFFQEKDSTSRFETSRGGKSW